MIFSNKKDYPPVSLPENGFLYWGVFFFIKIYC